MNLSSPVKMTTHSSPDDSSRDEEFDWDSYLEETNSEAAPAANFRQALIPPVNEFNLGEKLETIDPRNQDSWCIGTIIEKEGPRLRIRLDGTDDRNDFWRLVDAGDIRCYGSTEKLKGQIVPPLGFQQNSTRWAKYFERTVKNGPFAAESCFKSQPTKPERNFFKRGQKLEAVDPKHPQIICPATVSNVMSGDRRIDLSLDGWSSSNNFKVDYTSRDIFPTGWCRSVGIRLNKAGGNLPSRSSTKTTPNRLARTPSTKKISPSPVSTDSSYSPTTMDEKNNNLTSNGKEQHRASIESEPTKSQTGSKELRQPTVQSRETLVTVYLNYTGDNSGIVLNPQKFRFLMPSVFGPGDFSVVLTSIFDSCIKCAFQPTIFNQRILELFPLPDRTKTTSFTSIKLENGTILSLPHLNTSEDFWDVIRSLADVLLAGYDLFIATPPVTQNRSTCSSSSFLDSSVSPDKKDLSPAAHRSNSAAKRKSTEFLSATKSETETFLSNGKVARSSSSERSAYDIKPPVNSQPMKLVSNGGAVRRPERLTPNEVATFIRGIDPSFECLATRFQQEEIDGKALLLLTTDTLMRHMGLKLGPSLKIVHHIEQLKKSSSH